MLMQKRKEESVLRIEETFEEIIAVIMQRKEKLLRKINEAVLGRIQSLTVTNNLMKQNFFYTK